MTRPLARFLHVESAGGVVLLGATIIALVSANSPLAAEYAAFWRSEVRISLPGLELAYPLWYWVNDGLMAVFFFVIGLEIKRELVSGELADPKNVVLPLATAVGGAAVPAGIFLLIVPAGEARAAWAVPMATDIAFVVGCLALLGARVPVGLKVFMLALAIVDDLIAVLVIALFLTDSIHGGWLASAAVCFGAVLAVARLGVRNIGVYCVLGGATWLCTLKSGVHPTVAGAALGLATPARAWLAHEPLGQVIRRVDDELEAGRPPDRDMLDELAFAATEAVSPLDRLESALHPWVAFVILPLFAFANAAIVVEPSALAEPVALGIGAGLLLGKPIGIVAAAWLSVRLGLARLPQGVGWTAVFGGASLAGIGFTMALFVASLALPEEQLAPAKAGVLAASLLAALIGYFTLSAALRVRERDA